MDEDEISRFVKVWATAIASASYCYAIQSMTKKKNNNNNGEGGGGGGFVHHILLRLFLVVPVICLFTTLPYYLKSYHLGGITFFYLVWLGNFKLILFAFDLGPLSNPNLSLPQFLCVSLLPVKLLNPSDPNKGQTVSGGGGGSGDENGTETDRPYQRNLGRSVLLGAKVVLLVVIITQYEDALELPVWFTVVMMCCHVYLGVEIFLGATAAFVRLVTGLELEPQFNEPYLSTSLQDFWGRRWNLMVPDILRSTVYNPVRHVLAPLLGRRPSNAAGTVAAFTVSGLMHEWIYNYFSRVRPTWEVTWFFVLHGVCVSVEVLVKKKMAVPWRLRPVISTPLTVGFVAVTGYWLFFPQMLRSRVHLKVVGEYPVMFDLFRRNIPTSFHM